MDHRTPSDTATLIARGTLLSARDPDLAALLAPDEEESVRRILGDRASGGWFGFAMENSWASRALMLAERFLLGGIFTHYLARKRWIEKEVRQGLDQEIRQVIVLGAGYDSLACRLAAQFPEVSFIELDHPATQASKHAALAGCPNLHFMPVDLGKTMPADALAACAAFDDSLPSIVVAEGLTMYFPEEKVAGILRSAASLAGEEGRVIFTFMELPEDGKLSFRGQSPVVAWWLRLRSEPFLWGCSRDELRGFLRACGLKLDAVANHRDLRSRILAPRRAARLPLARGECLCLCHPLCS
ncbi:class I SAM-dependent methyltransferase [Luteolibacter luteus]|uniref:S-adenosyl-L-methionine-dependent methyltransferase n=1 Tax=Luteolibacter luteus TaxID=2728835 RepID=A0A858RG76_9BACT|nr:SAM-dependent methyltransferase [Luteolibacter luteus]QJE95591.1 class I SAM-dependent methyltransferase [Luteolibacter luteus]